MNLFVGNLPESIYKHNLESEFRKFGECSVSFFVTFIQGKFAFLNYIDLISAKNALKSWKGKKFEGKILNIEVCSTEHSEDFDLVQSETPRAVTPSSSLRSDTTSAIEPIRNNNSNATEVDSQLVFNNPENTNLVSEIVYLHKASKSNLPKRIAFNNEFCEVIDPFHHTKRGRKKKGEKAINPVKNIDKNYIEAYGSIYKVIKAYKIVDGNSIIKCLACDRIIKKKSIRSHAISNVHQKNYLPLLDLK
ncbi:hypothetical protein SteCoe_31723 [Stentor coeruleus]|uniref:RRM domain-containing protein n=1 Tax=Stentor coeruleus TaxID=5963 RepID=A0A1R2B0L9_9CILI|nr:hypothetical protein SteCoe_31723 [Stentor coeruleus]